jgi:predicted CXXCH cytochrome family protein
MKKMKSYVVISLILAVFISAGIFIFHTSLSNAAGGFYTSGAHGDADTGVYRISGEPLGDCVHCHYEHASYDGAHISGTDDYLLFTTNDNGLCFASDGAGPCHADQTDTYFGEVIYNNSTHGYTTVTFNGKPVGWCLQCHTPHGEGDNYGIFPNLNRMLEDNVCWQCHDAFGPADAVNIKAQNDKPYAHNVTMFSRKHDDWDEWEEMTHTPNPKLSGSNRHVECEDCHNDHYSRSGLHTIGNSEIPEVLLGAWGIRPTYGSTPWVTASSYEKVRFVNTTDYLEYYLCLKCHSDWAWGDDDSEAPTTTDGTLQTNHAVEFNPNNPSYHNVIGEPAANVPTDDTVIGTTDSLAYIGGWGPNSEMICTDCHSNDESASLATGPHGSIYNYMLKKRFKAVSGALDNTGQEGTQGDLCFECHDWNTYSKNASGDNTNFYASSGASGGRNLHAKPGHSAKAGCFTCHAAVIHGFKRKHFITYEVDGPPYYKGPIGEGLQAWAHNDNRDYTKNDCRANCHQGHAIANPPDPE